MILQLENLRESEYKKKLNSKCYSEKILSFLLMLDHLNNNFLFRLLGTFNV